MNEIEIIGIVLSDKSKFCYVLNREPLFVYEQKELKNDSSHISHKGIYSNDHGFVDGYLEITESLREISYLKAVNIPNILVLSDGSVLKNYGQFGRISKIHAETIFEHFMTEISYCTEDDVSWKTIYVISDILSEMIMNFNGPVYEIGHFLQMYS